MNPPLFMFALLAVSSIGLAQDAGRRARPPQNPLLTVLDTDRDGALSAEEIAAASAVLARLDRDGDGALSRQELVRFAPRGGGRPTPSTAPSPERPSLALDDTERQAMEVLAELDRNRRGNMNVPENDGRLLRMLVESTGAKTVVEIGTSNGYSSIWMALGMRVSGGHVTTHEIDPRRADVAQANMKRAGVTDRITIVLGDAHETVKQHQGPIDLLFLDADKPGYLDYLEQIFPKVRPGGLIIAHNMNRPTPDPAFLEAITTDPRMETLFLHMAEAGIAVTLKKAAPGQER